MNSLSAGSVGVIALIAFSFGESASAQNAFTDVSVKNVSVQYQAGNQWRITSTIGIRQSGAWGANLLVQHIRNGTVIGTVTNSDIHEQAAGCSNTTCSAIDGCSGNACKACFWCPLSGMCKETQCCIPTRPGKLCDYACGCDDEHPTVVVVGFDIQIGDQMRATVTPLPGTPDDIATNNVFTMTYTGN